MWKAIREAKAEPVDYTRDSSWVVPVNPKDGGAYLVHGGAEADIRCQSKPLPNRVVKQRRREAEEAAKLAAQAVGDTP